MPAPVAQLPTNQDLYWGFIPPKCGSGFYLHKLRLDPTGGGSAVMQRLREECNRVKSLPPYRLRDEAWIFWDPVIEIATLSEAHPSLLMPRYVLNRTLRALSQPTAPHRVFVSGRVPNAELIAAFYGPAILSGSNFIQRHSQSAANPKMIQARQQALLIRLEMNTLGILSLLLPGLVACFGPGVIVGFLTESADLGAAASLVVAPVDACVEVDSAIAFWRCDFVLVLKTV